MKLLDEKVDGLAQGMQEIRDAHAKEIQEIRDAHAKKMQEIRDAHAKKMQDLKQFLTTLVTQSMPTSDDAANRDNPPIPSPPAPIDPAFASVVHRGRAAGRAGALHTPSTRPSQATPIVFPTIDLSPSPDASPTANSPTDSLVPEQNPSKLGVSGRVRRFSKTISNVLRARSKSRDDSDA